MSLNKYIKIIIISGIISIFLYIILTKFKTNNFISGWSCCFVYDLSYDFFNKYLY